MRNRLIELIKESSHYVGDDELLLDRITDHLISNGVIVPPVMVGDKLYRIYWDFRIDECKVSAITIKADKSFKIRITSGINRSVFEITPDKIGKTVFLTKELAEKALAERSGE